MTKKVLVWAGVFVVVGVVLYVISAGYKKMKAEKMSESAFDVDNFSENLIEGALEGIGNSQESL